MGITRPRPDGGVKTTERERVLLDPVLMGVVMHASLNQASSSQAVIKF